MMTIQVEVALDYWTGLQMMTIQVEIAGTSKPLRQMSSSSVQFARQDTSSTLSRVGVSIGVRVRARPDQGESVH